MIQEVIRSVFYVYILNKRGPNKGILLKGVFIPKLLNNLLTSCSLINFNFLLSHTLHFDKSIILPFLVYATFEFLLSVFFFYALNNRTALFYI